MKHFDLVVCHMAWPMVVFGGAAKAAGLKVALWEHGFQGKENWLEWIARRMQPDYVIANSHFTAAIARNHFPHTPVGILYPAVVLAESPDRDQWRAAVRRGAPVDAEHHA